MGEYPLPFSIHTHIDTYHHFKFNTSSPTCRDLHNISMFMYNPDVSRHVSWECTSWFSPKYEEGAYVISACTIISKNICILLDLEWKALLKASLSPWTKWNVLSPIGWDLVGAFFCCCTFHWTLKSEGHFLVLGKWFYQLTFLLNKWLLLICLFSQYRLSSRLTRGFRWRCKFTRSCSLGLERWELRKQHVNKVHYLAKKWCPHTQKDKNLV